MGVSDTPQDQAKVLIDPEHPEAGRGGVVPPVHTRFPPGKSGYPGGRKKGASILHELERELAAGAEIGDDGEVIRSGHKAREIAQALLDVASGKRAPDEVDTKAALSILDRTDGPIVKETRNENTHLVQGIELLDRRPSLKDLPKVTSAEDSKSDNPK